MNKDKEGENKNVGEETVKKYVNMLDSTLESRNSREKNKWIDKTKDYLLSHSYIIQKYIENLDVKDKHKVILKLKRFKEEEVLRKEVEKKDFIKLIFIVALIFMLIMAVVGLTKKDEVMVIYSVITIVAITMLVISSIDYMYDISGLKREIKNIENWLIELGEEEHLLKENSYLKQQEQDKEEDINELKSEIKNLKQKNKKLEEDMEEVTLKLSNYI
ncbi:MAG TPA: hypothetical protein DEP72_02785 [Clostridiales bacterium]|nr:MAG: hypothetical protein A2Y18_01740 [Clostridiales bacterium GWD2_32_19]HCC07081.1 hypothetical protein [Clostridiales bacterium]